MWVVDFPMFEENDDGSFSAVHHPFTSPLDTAAFLAKNSNELDLGSLLSNAYDMVLNGTELGGGSVRIHTPEVQAKVFQLLGISDEEAAKKFGFLFRSPALWGATACRSGFWSGSSGDADDRRHFNS